MFLVLERAFSVVLDFFVKIFDSFFMSLPDFLSEYSSSFSAFLLDLIEFTGLTDFLSNFTLFSFVFTPVVIVVLIVYFLIP